MSYTSFDELNPVMVVACAGLSDNVNLGTFFHLVKITPFTYGTYFKGKRGELVSLIPGAITAAKFMYMYRGCPNTQGCFKNAVTLTLSIGTKNVCVKLSKDKIHVTGGINDDIMNWVTNICIQYIMEVKRMINYCKDNPDIIRVLPDILLHDVDVIITNMKTICKEDIPTDILETFSELFSKGITNTNSKSVCEDICGWMISCPYVCSDDIHTFPPEKIAVNYSYNVGFRILKPKVRDNIDGIDGFECENELNRCFVTIYLPYDNDDELDTDSVLEFDGDKILFVPKCDYSKTTIKRKKKRHTFMLYNTGKVTQSGPNEGKMKGAYDKFMSLLMTVKDEVMVK